MFPPLCFIDVTSGKVEDERSKSELDKQIDKDNKDEIEVKFKIVEIFERYIK